MNTEYLKYFIAACEHGSILEASRTLYITAQGLGKGIRRLEQSLGIKLLESSYNGVCPTEFGEQFYRQALIASNEFDRLQSMADEYRSQVQSRITIGTVGSTKFYYGILDFIQKYQKEHPGSGYALDVQRLSGDEELREDLKNGSIDIGLMFHGGKPAGLTYRILSDYSPLELIISQDHPLANKGSVSFDSLKELHFVVAANDDSFTDLLKELFRENGTEPHITFYSTENSNNARLLDSGICSMIVRESYADSILSFCSNSMPVRIVPEIPIAFSLVWNSSREFNSGQQLFVEMLADYFKILI